MELSAETQAYLKTLLSIVGVKSRHGKREDAVGSSSVPQRPPPADGPKVPGDQSVNDGVSQSSSNTVGHRQLQAEAARQDAFSVINSQFRAEAVPPGADAVPASSPNPVLSIEVESRTVNNQRIYIAQRHNVSNAL